MLSIEILGYATELYSHKQNKDNFDEAEFLEKHKENFYELNEDNFDVMTYGDKNISLFVTLNNENVLEEFDGKPLNEYGCEIMEPMEINYRDFSETVIDEKVVIWGHNGMFSQTYNFNEVDQFSIDKLKVFLLKLEEDIFITGITYDGQDPDDEEPDFAPKHGYWGPYIY